MSAIKRSKFIRFLGYAIPILLVVYVLSIGPALAIVEHSASESEYERKAKVVGSFYAPLIWCVEKNDFSWNLFTSYVVFCYRIFGPDTEATE